MTKTDGTYEACLSYLNAKGYVLWGDYSLNPNANDDGSPKNRPAARWLEAQVRGVADHYDTPDRTYTTASNTETPEEFLYRSFNEVAHNERTAANAARTSRSYAGPYSTETTGGGQRP